MSGHVDQKNNLGTTLPTKLTVALLIASIEAAEQSAAEAAIKTVGDSKVTWNSIWSRQMEEQRDLKAKHLSEEGSNAAHADCKQFHCEM